MKKTMLLGSALVLAAAVGSSFAAGGNNGNAMAPGAKSVVLGQSLPPVQDFGPLASSEQGAMLLGQIEGKWGNVMRLMKGWDDGAFQQFREGYRNYPVSVLEQALAADTFENMLSTFNPYAAAKAQSAMAKAFPMGATRPEDAANPQVVEASQLAAKTLGEDARDLVFIPVTPCTVWDTRYAASAPYMGIIGNGVTRQFWSHWNGSGGDFSPYGGNPACTEANQTFLGGRPFAVMMTVYVNDAVGNGWLTFYRDGDPDPSLATISVYYSTGPTRTQTVISKSSRGYGTGATDIAVTGRYGSANASASVTGYFIKPQATALDCVDTEGPITPTIPGSFSIQAPVCAAGYSYSGALFRNTSTFSNLLVLNNFYPLSGSINCQGTNGTGASVNLQCGVRCCRVPGR